MGVIERATAEGLDAGLIRLKILFKKPSNFSKPIAKIQKGRVLILQKCIKKWCKIESNKFKGWIKTDNIWGSIN